MEGIKFVYILEGEYREHLRREILSKKKGKSRKLTNKDKEFIDQKCLLAQFAPTVQKVELPAPPSPSAQEVQQADPQTSSAQVQEAAANTTDLPPANTSPAPEGLPQ